jgi:hypothetical protein
MPSRQSNVTSLIQHTRMGHHLQRRRVRERHRERMLWRQRRIAAARERTRKSERGGDPEITDEVSVQLVRAGPAPISICCVRDAPSWVRTPYGLRNQVGRHARRMAQ